MKYLATNDSFLSLFASGTNGNWRTKPPNSFAKQLLFKYKNLHHVWCNFKIFAKFSLRLIFFMAQYLWSSIQGGNIFQNQYQSFTFHQQTKSHQVCWNGIFLRWTYISAGYTKGKNNVIVAYEYTAIHSSSYFLTFHTFYIERIHILRCPWFLWSTQQDFKC